MVLLLGLTHSREEFCSGSMLQSGAAVFSSTLFALFLAHSVNVITFIYITVMVLPPTSCSTVFLLLLYGVTKTIAFYCGFGLT